MPFLLQKSTKLDLRFARWEQGWECVFNWGEGEIKTSAAQFLSNSKQETPINIRAHMLDKFTRELLKVDGEGEDMSE